MGSRALLLESDRTVLDSLASALRIAGLIVDTACTRVDALALMKRYRYGLIISNLRMPGLDGPTLYDDLERRWPRARPRVIFITESAFLPDYSRFLMEVGAPLLVKPVPPTELWDRVERELRDARS